MAEVKARTRKSKPTSGDKPMVITYIALKDLKQYPNNPNTGDVGIIAESLARNGQFKPIVVQKSTMYVLAGNHTFLAADKIGWDSIACVVWDVDDTEAKRIVIADNESAKHGVTDDDIMATMLASLPDVEGLGLDVQTANDLLALVANPEIDADLAAMVDDEITMDTVDDDTAGVAQYRDDVTFPSTNEWGIPDLLPDMIPSFGTKEHHETWAGPDLVDEVKAAPDWWHYGLRSAWSPSTKGLDFSKVIGNLFTDDHRFLKAYDEPASFVSRMVNMGITVTADAEFSTWQGDPLAMHLWSYYRRRWVGRYWQECGIQVIPTIGCADPARAQYAYLGLPEHIPSAFLNLQNVEAGADSTLHTGLINRLRDEITVDTLLVYASEPGALLMKSSGYKGRYVIVEPMNRKRRRIGRGIQDPRDV